MRSGTLTIEPGTTILGGGGSALVIEKGASIDAQGTADAPIVMTSVNYESSPNRGDWGGLVLLGTAGANVDGVAEGFADDPPTYGGDDDAYNCGTLRYVRVEYAGNEVSPGNELNGITFYACGTGTTVENVQVHMGLDDGIEMFGGNFNARNIVVTGAADDSIDCDQGFRGTLTNVFIHQDPTLGDNCLEWSNQGNDFSAEPLTSPTISNMTCIGSGAGGETSKSKGITIKEGTQATVQNSLFIDLTNQAAILQNQATQTQAESGAIAFNGTHFCGGGTYEVDTDDEDMDPVSWGNEEFAEWMVGDGGAIDGTDCMLPSTTWGSPSIVPAAMIEGAGTYAGAVDPSGEDWTAQSWINYTP
ncbi:MAG: hypothetical protein AAGF11_35905 [Myxococcota bacterium]